MVLKYSHCLNVFDVALIDPVKQFAVDALVSSGMHSSLVTVPLVVLADALPFIGDSLTC